MKELIFFPLVSFYLLPQCSISHHQNCVNFKALMVAVDFDGATDILNCSFAGLLVWLPYVGGCGSSMAYRSIIPL